MHRMESRICCGTFPPRQRTQLGSKLVEFLRFKTYSGTISTNFNFEKVSFAKAMEASTRPFEGSSTYYEHINKFFVNRRDKLDGILKKNSLDLNILTPDGGYFILADVQDAIKKVPKKYFYKEGTSNDTSLTKDWKALQNPDFPPDSAFCRYLSYEWGVTPLPISAFYDNSNSKSVKDWRGTNFIRFVLCKMDPTMEKLDSLINKK
jgi:aspartate/methionine/tyrosine aminotransferase